MNRFFGMMPSNEIEVEKYYKDKNGFSITIQAGVHGWTILYADSSSEYKDIDAETEKNFDSAYNRAVSVLGELELKDNTNDICCEE